MGESLKKVTKVAETKLVTERNSPIKPRITNKIVDLIKEQRKYKNKKNDEDKRNYKIYKNVIIRESKKEKEKWMNGKCSSVDDCLSKSLGDKVYKIIKRFFNQNRSKSYFLKR